MSAKPSARELHLGHLDEVNRVNQLQRQERIVIDRTRLRVVAPLVQAVDREHRTPIVRAYDHNEIVDHMLAPGDVDDTGFSDGVC